jgi:hypothetical protein
MTQDRYEAIGTPQGSTADVLTPTPIGSTPTPQTPPYLPGQGAGTPPVEAQRSTHYPIGGGTPA